MRPIEFSLFLFPLIVQRALVLTLYIVAATYADLDSITMPFAMDATYAGLHAPTALKHIVILGWVLLAVAALSAYLERCYKWPNAVFLYAVLTALMAFMTLNTLTVYDPYLAVRR